MNQTVIVYVGTYTELLQLMLILKDNTNGTKVGSADCSAWEFPTGHRLEIRHDRTYKPIVVKADANN
jgi:hypothetical protein